MLIYPPEWREAMIKAMEPFGVQSLGGDKAVMRFDQICLDKAPNDAATLRITFMWKGQAVWYNYVSNPQPPLYIGGIEGSAIMELWG